MDPLDVIQEAAQTAYSTLAYLWAYAFSIGWAFVVSGTLQALFHENKLREYVAKTKHWARIAGVIALGLVGSPRRKIIASNISWLIRSTKFIWLLPLYLVGSCNLTIYYWLLLGPLLGKEFVMVNIVGAIFFLLVTCPMLLLFKRIGAQSSGSIGHGAFLKVRTHFLRRFPEMLAREVITVGPWVLGGLLLGGLIAVWGLSSWWFDLSQIGGAKSWLSQFLNALIGLGFAIATFSTPVANLFVATYLWKTGIAFSGFLAYLFGGMLAPLLWPAYTESLGRKRAFYLLCVLAAGVIVASLGVTAFWKLAGLGIHYKLSSNQML